MDVESDTRIAEINDRFRKSGTAFMLTQGTMVLGDVTGLIDAVRTYSDFNEDNDPWGEHDFGSLDWYGNKLFWKIDYYDQELKYGKDPLDLTCNRVLTILLADEY